MLTEGLKRKERRKIDIEKKGREKRKGQESSSSRTITSVTRRPVSAQYKAELQTEAANGHLGLSMRGGTSDHRKG